MKQLREVKVFDLITYLPLSTLILFAAWISFAFFASNARTCVFWLSLIACIVLSYYLLKRMVIGAVLFYKAFAPIETRERCRFTPTCSTYAIMAINKYGLFIGVYKAIKRITRCRVPNGGVDYP